MRVRAFAMLLCLAGSALLAACSAVTYVRSEASGTAKPAGGIAEPVAATRTYRATPQATRAAVLAVLAELGFIADDNPAAPTIRTEPKQLPQNESMLVQYSARAFVTIAESSVTYRARFDKKSSVTGGEMNAEFPEKENELRKQFFDALDARLPAQSPLASSPRSEPSSVSPAAAAAHAASTNAPPAKTSAGGGPPERMSVSDMQRRLSELGYSVGAADGKLGPKSIEALKKFQQAHKLAVTGRLDIETEAKLRAMSR